jgi:hypothetical protein
VGEDGAVGGMGVSTVVGSGPAAAVT